MGAGIGPSIFFPLTAIQSVPFLIVAICLAIRGMVTVPEKKSLFKGMLIFYGIFVAVFLPAVIGYTWMYIATPYDLLYHSLGFITSIVILATAVSTASRYGVKWKGLFPAVYFGCWGFQILMIVVPGGSSIFISSTASIATALCYGVYGLAQIFIPFLATRNIVLDKQKYINDRLAVDMKPIAPVGQAMSPYYSAEAAANLAQYDPIDNPFTGKNSGAQANSASGQGL